MRRGNPCGSAPGSRGARGLALATLLGAAIFALLPRVALAGEVRDLRPQGGPNMTPHAPVEVSVSPELKEVLTRLMCQCGCNLDAYQCEQTMTCNVSKSMWKQAAALVDRGGVSPERALEIFALDYGERVLAAPTKRGFNLTAWITPFVALVLGTGVVLLTLRRWKPRTAPVAIDDAVGIERRYLDEIERELQEDG